MTTKRSQDGGERLGILRIAVLVAWKTADWWGLDRFVLPRIGAPWRPGSFFGGSEVQFASEHKHTRRRDLEEWTHIAIGGAIHAYALTYMSGPMQIAVSVIGVAMLAATGLGLLYIAPHEKVEATVQ